MNYVVLGETMKGFISSILLTASILPTLAFAKQANTINFRGEIASKTCNVSINGNSTSPVVLLPTVTSTALTTAGQTAGNTEFSIEIKDCTQASKAKAWIYTALNGGNGNVLNTGGTASNVEIRILDGVTQQQILMAYATSQVNISPSGTASIPLVAQYYSTGNTGAGSVIGTALYTMAYE